MDKIKFRDIKDSEKEKVRAVSVSIKDRSGKIVWNYPLDPDLTEVCIFELPLKSEFSEADAEAGKYKMFSVKHPVDELRSSGICNYAVFPVDKDGVLVRQKKSVYRVPVRVKWSVQTVEKKTETEADGSVSFFGRLFGRKTGKSVCQYDSYLELNSDVEIEGSKILYNISVGKGDKPNKTMTFCLPTDITPGRTARFKMPQLVELFSAEDDVVLEKVEGQL